MASEMIWQGRDGYTHEQIGNLPPPPKTKEQWLNEGINHYNAKRYEESLKACERAIQLDSHYTEAYYGKGLTLSKLGRYEEALEAYERAILLNSHYFKAHNGKGNTLYKLTVRLNLDAITRF